MPDEYIDIPLETNPDVLVQRSIADVQATYPDWEPDPSNLEVILLQIDAQMSAEERDVMSRVGKSIFRYLLAGVFKILPIDAKPATATIEFVVDDNNGRFIPQGFTVGIPSVNGANDLVGFATTDDLVIPAGSTTGQVTASATVDGSIGSNLTGKPVAITALDFVVDLNLIGRTIGGLDAEADDDYLARGAAELSLISPRPILAQDAAKLIRTKIAGIYRATGIDNFIPAGAPPGNGGTGVNQSGVEKSVTVSGVDSNGDVVSPSIRTDALQLLIGTREVNFYFNWLSPSYPQIDLAVTAVRRPDAASADLESAIVAELSNFISKATWGTFGTTGETPQWENVQTLRYNDVLAVLYRIPALRNVTDLTIGLHGGALVAADVDLTNGGANPIALPELSALGAGLAITVVDP